MRVRDLARRVLQQIGIGSLQHPRRTAVKTRGMLAQAFSASASFDANQLYPLVLDELMKDANGIRAPADASDNRGRQLAFGFQNLSAGLAPDDLVKIAHHRGVRMGAEHAAQKIMRGANVGYPIAHG